MLAAKMRATAELREERKATKAAADEVGKLKLNADKYKKKVGELKKSVKTKDKELSKSANNLKKAENDLAAIRTQIQEILVELKKLQALEEHAKVARDQDLKDKQALIDNQAVDLEKAVEQGYNEAVIASTKEMGT